MRMLIAISIALSLTACAGKKAPPVAPVQPVVSSGPLIGMSSSQLTQRFGAPYLQIREGESIKLQYRSALCVLDAYLYPDPRNRSQYRVLHVDTRTRGGDAMSEAACVPNLGR